MKKQQLQVYTLKDSKIAGKQRKIIQTESFEEARINENAPNYVVHHHHDGTSEELYRFLQTNPFLYKGQYQITSIEDYYINVKKDKVPFGAVMRSKDLSHFQKRRIAKKALKGWKQDFLKEKNAVFNKQNNQLVVVGEVSTTRFTIANYIAIIIILLLLSLITFKNGIMWTSFASRSFFSKLNAGIEAAFAHRWLKIASTLTLYQLFLTFFYSLVHNFLIKDYIKTNIGTHSVYEKSCRTLKKNFKTKYRITKKYYLKGKWKKPLQIAPLPIDKTAIGGVDLDEIKALIDNFIKKSASLKRKKSLLTTIRFLMIFFSYGGGLAVIGYTLYSIIIRLF